MTAQLRLATALLTALIFLAGCQAISPAATPGESAASGESSPASQADLDGIKSYLVEKSASLSDATASLQQSADAYYALAEGAGFDYAALWSANQAEVVALVEEARAAWRNASPLYEQIEGIVAGTPSLAQYDVDLDAGSAATEDPESAVSFDMTLPSGTTLEKPGNLFGVTESTLWGTFDAYRAPIDADFDGSGSLEFGEALPDADVLKGGADLLAQMTSDLHASAEAWQPTESDAFTALVVMVPTMSEYFASWRDSRFVSGDDSTQRDFVAISRLADILVILGGLQVVYGEVRPRVESVDAAQAEQIEADLAGLLDFVSGIYTQEQEGTRFTPEEADLLGAEAQNRATAITGQIAQVAAQLAIPLAE